MFGMLRVHEAQRVARVLQDHVLEATTRADAWNAALTRIPHGGECVGQALERAAGRNPQGGEIAECVDRQVSRRHPLRRDMFPQRVGAVGACRDGCLVWRECGVVFPNQRNACHMTVAVVRGPNFNSRATRPSASSSESRSSAAVRLSLTAGGSHRPDTANASPGVTATLARRACATNSAVVHPAGSSSQPWYEKRVACHLKPDSRRAASACRRVASARLARRMSRPALERTQRDAMWAINGAAIHVVTRTPAATRSASADVGHRT